MEVFKAIAKQELASQGNVAIKADQQSYSYKQLISSAQNISDLLCASNVKVVSYTFEFLYFSLCEIKLHILLCSKSLVSRLLTAQNFQGNLGGARIGIVAKPSAEFVAGVLGTWFSGGVAVPLALSYPEVELLYVMDNSVLLSKPSLFLLASSFCCLFNI